MPCVYLPGPAPAVTVANSYNVVFQQLRLIFFRICDLLPEGCRGRAGVEEEGTHGQVLSRLGQVPSTQMYNVNAHCQDPKGPLSGTTMAHLTANPTVLSSIGAPHQSKETLSVHGQLATPDGRQLKVGLSRGGGGQMCKKNPN